MKVLSLFDGMSCGQIALKQLGIIPEVYYASEIDKHAIKQTQLNFPDTIQLGDVTKWKEWDIDWKSIDLVLAGSPCQGFSFAGKQLAFDDPRSKLFFVFIDILNHIRSLNPDVLFLLENVNMKKAHMRIISEYCGVFPVNINSNLVSAQNRDRWYWTNIRTKQVGLFGEVYTDIPQPEDKGIFLRDILEDEVDEKYYVSQAVLDRMNNPHKNFSPKVDPEKTGCLSTGNNSAKMSFDSGTTFISVYNGMTLVKGIIQLSPSKDSGGVQPYQQDRIYDVNGIAPALCSGHGGMGCNVNTDRIRRLTPTECARLQTIPSWYRLKCSDTQIYKMLGNGWTVDVIVHILSFMKEKLNINVV
ncbi:DNA cytosine methyltransferase [Bacteroides thetaiotaomicron]|uniref:DNA cytosine methyltransferase n=1 Tax=Bacteroides thetaiotaomicron TaxID=818 RepID=UPI00205D6B48|nr:MAG TPA: Cytosine specific methyltransferase [Caudoviricetes sp.]